MTALKSKSGKRKSNGVFKADIVLISLKNHENPNTHIPAVYTYLQHWKCTTEGKAENMAH